MKSLAHGDRQVGTFVKIFALAAALIVGVLLVGTGLGTYQSRAGMQSNKQYCKYIKTICSGKKAYSINCTKFGKQCLKAPPTPKASPTKKLAPTPKVIPTKNTVPTPTPTLLPPPTTTPSPTPTLTPTPTN